jgi:iron complex outermembrane receptor protein
LYSIRTLDTQGEFFVKTLKTKLLLQTMILCGISCVPIAALADASGAASEANVISPASSSTLISVGEVSAGAGSQYRSKKHKKNIKTLSSTLHVIHINRQQIENSVPPGGSIAYALKNVPGVQVQGYGGPNGAQRNEIRINGVTAGWTGTGSNPERNAIQFNFDGIPQNDPYADWEGFETSTVPIASIFQSIKVTQGPGNPASRFYDALGGTVDLIPWQPAKRASAMISAGGASFASYHANATIQTGDLDGWRTVISGGYTKSESFRTNNYHGGGQGSAIYLKTEHKVLHGDGLFSFGGYFSNIEEYRPKKLPIYNISGVTVNGINVPGEYYSQQEQGYYYNLPNSLYYKQVQGHVYMTWVRFMLHLTKNLQVTNTVWYRFGHRMHDVVDNYIYGSYSEDYHVDRNEFGDKLAFEYLLPENTVKFGLSYITMRTAHHQWGYDANPSVGGWSDPTYIRDLIYNWENASPYIQDTIRPFKWIRITPGLMLENYEYRWIDNSLSAIPFGDPYLSSNLALYPTGGTVPGLPNNSLFIEPNKQVSYNNLDPSVGVNVRFTPHMAGYFTWAIHHTTPQEGAFWGNSAGDVPQNAVRVNSFIGGLRFVKGDYQAELSAFYQRFKNQFVLNSNSYDGATVDTLSKLSSTYNGVNLSLSYQPEMGFDALLNATVQHDYYNTYTNKNGSTYGLPISNVPTYTIYTSIGYGWYMYRTDWRVRLADSYSGGYNMFNGATSLPTTVRWGGHNVVNFMASASTMAFDKSIPGLEKTKFIFGIDNLLNRKYESITELNKESGNTPLGYFAFPGAPLSVFGSVSMQF